MTYNDKKNNKSNIYEEDNKNVELCFIRKQLELNTDYDVTTTNSNVSKNHK